MPSPTSCSDRRRETLEPVHDVVPEPMPLPAPAAAVHRPGGARMIPAWESDTVRTWMRVMRTVASLRDVDHGDLVSTPAGKRLLAGLAGDPAAETGATPAERLVQSLEGRRLLHAGDLDGIAETCWRDGSMLMSTVIQGAAGVPIHGTTSTLAGTAEIGDLTRPGTMRITGDRILELAGHGDRRSLHAALRHERIRTGSDTHTGVMERSMATLITGLMGTMATRMESDMAAFSAWSGRQESMPKEGAPPIDLVRRMAGSHGDRPLAACAGALLAAMEEKAASSAAVAAAPAWAKPFVAGLARLRSGRIDAAIKTGTTTLRRRIGDRQRAAEHDADAAITGFRRVMLASHVATKDRLWSDSIPGTIAASDLIDATIAASVVSGRADPADALNRRIDGRIAAIETCLAHIAAHPDEVREPRTGDSAELRHALAERSRAFRKLITDTVALIPTAKAGAGHKGEDRRPARVAERAYGALFDAARTALTTSAASIMASGERTSHGAAKRLAAERLRGISLAVTSAIAAGESPERVASGVFVRFISTKPGRDGKIDTVAPFMPRASSSAPTAAGGPTPLFRTFKDADEAVAVWAAPIEELFHLDHDPELLSESLAYGSPQMHGVVMVVDNRAAGDHVDHANDRTIQAMAGASDPRDMNAMAFALGLPGHDVADPVKAERMLRESFHGLMASSLTADVKGDYADWMSDKQWGARSSGTMASPERIPASALGVVRILADADLVRDIVRPAVSDAVGGPTLLPVQIDIIPDPADRTAVMPDMSTLTPADVDACANAMMRTAHGQRLIAARLAASPWWEKNGVLVQAILESNGDPQACRQAGQRRATPDIAARLYVERATGCNCHFNHGITGQDGPTGCQEFILTTSNRIDRSRVFLFPSERIPAPNHR